MKLTITNAKTIECSMAFPPTAVSARIRVFDVVPPDSGVLVYTPATRDNPIRFDGPETTAEVPVEGHQMFARSILGNKAFQMEFLGYRDNL